MTEFEQAVSIANKVLDRISADPDDDLAILARQLLRLSGSTEMKIGKTTTIKAKVEKDLSIHNRGDLIIVTIEHGPIIHDRMRANSVGAGLSPEQATEIGIALIAAARAIGS